MNEAILNKKLDLLDGMVQRSSEKIQNWKYRTAKYKTPEDIEFTSKWLEFKDGLEFEPLTTVYFKTTYTIPADKNYFDINLVYGEALMSINGKPYAGIDKNHTTVPIKEELKGVRVEIEIEMIAFLDHICRPDLYETAKISFNCAEHNEDVKGLVIDLNLLRETTLVVRNERRRLLLEKLLEDAMLIIDLTNTDKVFLDDVIKARKLLSEGLGKIGRDEESEDFTLSVIHILMLSGSGLTTKQFASVPELSPPPFVFWKNIRIMFFPVRSLISIYSLKIITRISMKKSRNGSRLDAGKFAVRCGWSATAMFRPENQYSDRWFTETNSSVRNSA